MGPNILTLFTLAALVSGCVSYEGTYSPDCIAFQGSNVQLRNGRFVWEKFTDQVLVDDQGNVINQFPGYPKQGSYRIEDQIVHLETDGGERMESMYLHERDNHFYLLTQAQFEAWENTGKEADCPLMLGGNSGG